MDIHSWHRLGMWLIGAFVIGHVYMALREDIMSDDTVISTMVNGYRSHKFGKISNRSVHERATRGGHGAGQPAVGR